MNMAEVAQSVAVVAFVLSVACGYLSARRAKSFNYPWQWPGVMSVLVLAAMAWPYTAPVTMEYQSVRNVVKASDPLVGVLINTLQRFEKIQSERQHHAVTTN